MNSMLELIPAKELTAQYDATKGELTLSAKGSAQRAVYNFMFKREPFEGSLKFTFYGWAGHANDKQPYTYSQAFRLPLPSPAYSSEHLTIVAANHPRGIKIPISFTGVGPTLPLEERPQALLPTPSATLVPGSTLVNVLFQEFFQIKESTSVPRGGEVNVHFDANFLELNQAAVQDGDIVWTFNPLQTGNTQVIVTVLGGVSQYTLYKVYDVRIFMLNDVAGRRGQQAYTSQRNPDELLSNNSAISATANH